MGPREFLGECVVIEVEVWCAYCLYETCCLGLWEACGYAVVFCSSRVRLMCLVFGCVAVSRLVSVYVSFSMRL